MENSTTKSKWYDKTWLVLVLCIVFFPIGFYGLYKNPSLPTVWKMVITFFISLFVIAQISNNGKNSSTTTATTAIDTTATIAIDTIAKDSITNSNKKEPETSIGKEILVGHFSYIITGKKFKKTVGGEFGSETADGIYLLVNLTIKNISDETRTLDGSCFYLTDLNDVKFEHSINGSTALEMSGIKSLFLKECQPRIKTNGVLIFEVPEKGEYYLHLAGNFMGSSSVRVLLN